MKKNLILFAILATLLLLVGCAGPRAASETTKVPTAPTKAPVDDVNIIEADVGDVASLDKELNLDELEGIDEDLNLGL